MLGLSLDFEIWIRDAGWFRFNGTYRIKITLRFRVRHGREILRNQNNRILEALKGFKGGSVLSNRPSFGLHFEVVVLKGFKRILFFLAFSLDKKNIGCPLLPILINTSSPDPQLPTCNPFNLVIFQDLTPSLRVYSFFLAGWKARSLLCCPKPRIKI